MRITVPSKWAMLAIVPALFMSGPAVHASNTPPSESVGAPADSWFTYQGQLAYRGELVNERCGFVFRMFDAPQHGNQIGTAVQFDDLMVVNGLFSVDLDFGFLPSDQPVWVETIVNGSVLSPRQAILRNDQPLSEGERDQDENGSANKEDGSRDGKSAKDDGARDTKNTDGPAGTTKGLSNDRGGTQSTTGVGNGDSARDNGLGQNPPGDDQLSGDGSGDTGPGLGQAGELWQLNGNNDIFYDNGNVGIGVRRPDFPLTLAGQGPRAVSVTNSKLFGNSIAIRGNALGKSGKGLVGVASAPTGITTGVEGSSTSVAGTGVFGLAKSATGTTFGISGEVRSTDGYAGYFVGGRNYFQGNVGVGTTTPAQPLDVVGNIGVTGTVDGVDVSAHAANANAHHTPPTTLPPSGAAGGDLSGTYPNPGVLDDSHSHTDSTVADSITLNNGRLFAPTGAGNVGVGTTTPAQPLDVVGNIGVTGTVDGVDVSAHAANANAHHTPPTTLPPSGTAGGDLSGTYPNPGVLDDSHNHADATVADSITLNNGRLFAPTGAGNVGVGTTTPAQPLDVVGNIGVTGTVDGVDVSAHAANANAHHTPPTTLPPSGAAGGDLSGTYPNPGVLDDSHSHTDSTVADNLSINNTRLIAPAGAGNVGISRIATVNALEVEGNASKTVAGSWLANSDARIKTDVRRIGEALNTLDRVRLVDFRYTDDYRSKHPAVGDHRYLNVIAQEFREVFPDHVKGSGEKLPNGEEILQVDTYPLTIYSAAAIQELHTMVKSRNREIAALRSELDTTSARLEQLEALVARLAAEQK